MDVFLGIAPLAVLIIIALWLILRGIRLDPHDKDTGGGEVADGE